VAVFAGEREASAGRDLEHLGGVILAEPFRTTSVRIRRGGVTRTVPVTGMEIPNRLYRLVDVSRAVHTPPSTGAAITVGLARALGVEVGDTLTLELLEQGGVERRVTIVGAFDPMIGQGLFMSRAGLNDLLREADLATGAYLTFEPGRERLAFDELKEAPAVAGAVSRAATIQNIDEQMEESTVYILSLIITSACLIAVGVVYNSARIALSERGRELASLRVLGFTTNEVATMLLGEQAAVLLLALPVGLGIGALFSYALVQGFETERFHFPFVLTLRSQLFAMGVVTLAAVLASLVVRGRVGRLNLVSALRTRE
jgi:putative ABC transport system permease protein